MSKELTKAIYSLLSHDKPVTPAGACYLLRNDFTPIVVIGEAERVLWWLRDNAFATYTTDNGFGPEFLKDSRMS